MCLSPRIGPVGTAICLYEAENSGSFGGGIFDIFREDLQTPDGFNEVQNDFLEVSGDGGRVEGRRELFPTCLSIISHDL